VIGAGLNRSRNACTVLTAQGLGARRQRALLLCRNRCREAIGVDLGRVRERDGTASGDPGRRPSRDCRIEDIGDRDAVGLAKLVRKRVLLAWYSPKPIRDEVSLA